MSCTWGAEYIVSTNSHELTRFLKSNGCLIVTSFCGWFPDHAQEMYRVHDQEREAIRKIHEMT